MITSLEAGAAKRECVIRISYLTPVARLLIVPVSVFVTFPVPFTIALFVASPVAVIPAETPTAIAAFVATTTAAAAAAAVSRLILDTADVKLTVPASVSGSSFVPASLDVSLPNTAYVKLAVSTSTFTASTFIPRLRASVAVPSDAPIPVPIAVAITAPR
jgi:hypothetical protein